MSDDIKLLPCPFCGGELEYSFLLGVSECKCCGVMIGFPKLTRHEDKIVAINTRKPIDMIVEKLEEKKEEYLDGFSTHKERELYGVACGFGDSIKIIKAGGKV